MLDTEAVEVEAVEVEVEVLVAVDLVGAAGLVVVDLAAALVQVE